jgi:transposase-like protein
MKTEVERILDDIVMILDHQGKTVADLARDLNRDYHQVYDWIKIRKFNPQAQALFQLINWRHKNISARRKRAKAVLTEVGAKG